MTPEERAAIEMSLNTLIGNAFQLLIAVFAVAYFGYKGWLWLSKKLPALPISYVTKPTQFPTQRQEAGNHSSYAAEPARNHTVAAVAEPVPVDRDKPIKLDDLLTELALLEYVDRDGEVKQFSATKIAEFIGGRKSDTLEAVRKARGEPEPEPADGLRVRDAAGERVISRA